MIPGLTPQQEQEILAKGNLPKVDRSKRWQALVFVPSIDVCAICSDSECDGISCISDLNPDDEEDREMLEQLQAWIRAGRAFDIATAVLAEAENRL